MQTVKVARALLLLCLGFAGAARAQTNITVGASDEAGLIAAINAANADLVGPRTITLTASTYTFTAVDNVGSSGNGDNALPKTLQTMTIVGNGATLDRTTVNMRFFEVSAGTLTLQNLTLRNGATSAGGAIYLELVGAFLTLERCTLTGNSASNGGAICLNGPPGLSATLRHCTLEGNTALIEGGALRAGNAAVTVNNCTIVRNSATDVMFGSGGGVSCLGPAGTLTSTILALNTSASGSAPDGFGSFVLASSWVGNTNGMTITDSGGNVLSGDPLLGALQDNGGLTSTCAVQSGSLAIDAGSNPDAATSDQRGTDLFGAAFARVETTADKGAYEHHDAPTAIRLVAANVTATAATYQFTVTYLSDDAGGIDVASLGNTDITVTGPGYALPEPASFQSSTVSGGARSATYQIATPGGDWTAAENGTYTITLAATEVFDTDAAPESVPGGALGTFTVTIDPPPTATITAALADVTTPGASPSGFMVTYDDGAGLVSVATLGSGTDVIVNAPGAIPDMSATFVTSAPTADASTITGTYSFTPPGGAWDEADNGTYTIETQATQVSDTNGNFVVASTIDTFIVSIDQTPPTASATSTAPTGAGGTSQTVTVTYTDTPAGPGAIESTTLNTGDITVSGPGFGPVTATIVTAQGADGTPKVIDYSFTPPGGAWDPADNGTYTIALAGTEVSDTSGNFAVAGANIGQFTVAIETTAPTAAAAQGNITAAGAATQQITVTYTDASGIDVSDLDGTDIRITGPGAFNVLASFVTVDINTDGSPRVATYQFATPGGSWNAADNGTYTISMEASQVRDVNTNFVAAGALDTFDVIIDPNAPTAVGSAANVAAPGGTTHTITVTYTDDVAISIASLGSGTDVVVNPGALAATFVSVDVATDGTPRVGTYSITPPGGAWDAADNGTYTIAMQAAQVTDTSTNAVAAGNIGTFTVNISAGVPTAVATAANVTTPATTYTFTVTYTDDVAISIASLGSGTDVVVNPGALAATFVSVDVATDGTPRVATYTITPPGGSWDFGDNGAYTVAMQAAQVTDTAANAVAAGTIGTFTVGLPDTTAPTAAATSSTRTSATAQLDFTVTYADNVAVDVTTLGTGDLLVSGPNGFTQTPALVTVDVSSNGTPRVATYRVTSSSFLSNGAYVLTMVAGQVADTSGNTVAAGTLATVTLNVATASSGGGHGVSRNSTQGVGGGGGCSFASTTAPSPSGWAPLALAVLALLAVRQRHPRKP